MLRVFAAAIAALGYLALGPAAAHAQSPAPFTNPLYRQWAGFAAGTGVAFTDRVTENGEPGNVSPTSCTVQPGDTCTITMNDTACNSGTAHFDVFTASSSGSYTVEQNCFEVATEVNAISAEPGDCDEYTTWTMAAHAGDGVNDLKTDVAITGGSAADGCATPEGGTGTATVKD